MEDITSNNPPYSEGGIDLERMSTPKIHASESKLEMDLSADGASENDRKVANLARQLSAQPSHTQHQVPFMSGQDSSLDPQSPDFNAKAWANEFYNVRYQNDQDTGPRVAGVALRNLNVSGYGSSVDYQASVGNAILKLAAISQQWLGSRKQRVDILRDIDGLILPGEQLCVLGPPGSGCSTFLKTIAQETHGLEIDQASYVNYQGITAKQMGKDFRGEAIYTAEVDAHYPQLGVGDTLYFAALARAPREIPGGITREEYAILQRDVIMATFGISHTVNTRVGNDFVRGVSGGERKRVTIAEAALSYAPLQCWDNSTRGLDSANAVEFCRTLRTQGDVFGVTSCVAIYQAPQAAYDLFDKVTVLYEGRQIFFGPAQDAKNYFVRLGFVCPDAQTTPDFLTSMCSPSERIVHPDSESHVPRTADEFVNCWKESSEYKALIQDIDHYAHEHPFNATDLGHFTLSRQEEKSKVQRSTSPYTLSYWGQVSLCLWRDFQRLKSDPSVSLAMLIGNFFESLIIASLFYDLSNKTSSFFSRGALLFMMVLLNAFSSLLEIIVLYEKRSIIEKHRRYALYHPSAEAISSILMDMPYKITNSILTNLVMYFMSNLRREPGAFFFLLLVSFSMMMGMSMFFRFFASLTKSIEQALAPSAIILLALVLYTGFTIPVKYMRGWASWIRWLNPVAYGFEAVMVNEFHGREFQCSSFVPSGPGYENVSSLEKVCSVVGAVPGSGVVQGTEYIRSSFGYENSHRWRNFGIIVALTVFLACCHLVTSELVSSRRSKGEVLVFRRGKALSSRGEKNMTDEEKQSSTMAQNSLTLTDEPGTISGVEKQVSIFHWQNVTYDIKIKKEPRRILDQVDGWIRPGTLTALMGVSGAGKTTLLDVLASRTTVGVVGGEMLVDGRPRDESFQRKTGYVQQQDIHLHTSTVREALEFSALLRQPPEYSRAQKLAYVDTVIDLMNMREYADAIVGVPGEGLNVEQRKRLTIGVEVAARPKLLLFLDEPTSGLDSQTSWSICNLMDTLTKNGQAILCTIHQPSAMLFERFDRLLLLARGGKTVYFGEVGQGAKTLMEYFVRNGGASCPSGANPAEHMLNVIGAAPGVQTNIDWPSVWRKSPEYQAVQIELAGLKNLTEKSASVIDSNQTSSYSEFAAPLYDQIILVGRRVFQQYWRTPSYIYSKALLTVGSSLFIGFSFFKADNTKQGLQNQMFGVFVFLFVIVQLVLQIIPAFVAQRIMYESRERQSKTYAWQAFILSNIAVEFAWNSLMAILCFIVWFYPVGFYQNAQYTDTVHARSTHALLLIWASFLFTSSFGHMLVALLGSAEIASALANIMFILMYAFCGILAGPTALPRFWIFMYRVNPMTYLVSSFLSTSLGDAPMRCADNEVLSFSAPAGKACADYMKNYISANSGYLLSSGSQMNDDCKFCAMGNSNDFLSSLGISFSNRWRDFGILCVYIVVNTVGAIVFYKLFRVPRSKTVKN